MAVRIPQIKLQITRKGFSMAVRIPEIKLQITRKSFFNDSSNPLN